MRLAFVTARFGAAAAAPAELLAAELVERAPRRWSVTVLTTTESAGTPLREGQTQEGGVRVWRFAAGTAGGSSVAEYLSAKESEFDLIVVFGIEPAFCREAAAVAPERTSLLPFAGFAGFDPTLAEDFARPAAFLFGSEAEEVRALKHYPIHHRMRETVGGSLVLSQTADPAAFRQREGLTGPYLVQAGPVEPERGIEEFLRFFSTFRQRRPGGALDLVLFGPAAIQVPDRPDIRVLRPGSSAERLDAIAGALAAVVPERLAEFGAAAEPFSLGVPIIVGAGATQLVADCRASNGGLYYGNYDEFELILELGLRDPALFGRMGAAGAAYLTERNDWAEVIARYDRAFRSFARPVVREPGAAPQRGAAGDPDEGPGVVDDVEGEPGSADAASRERDEIPGPDEPTDKPTGEPPVEADPETESELPDFFRGSIRD